MTAKQRKLASKDKYSKAQYTTLIVCAIIMTVYIVLAYFVTEGSFWYFATIHTILTAITVLFITLGSAPKALTYTVISLSVLGGGIALGLIFFYLTIVSNLANG